MTLLVYIILACAGRHYLISECFTYDVCTHTRTRALNKSYKQLELLTNIFIWILFQRSCIRITDEAAREADGIKAKKGRLNVNEPEGFSSPKPTYSYRYRRSSLKYARSRVASRETKPTVNREDFLSPGSSSTDIQVGQFSKPPSQHELLLVCHCNRQFYISVFYKYNCFVYFWLNYLQVILVKKMKYKLNQFSLEVRITEQNFNYNFKEWDNY